MRNRSRGLVTLAIVLAAPAARAEGEWGPMFGGGIVARQGSESNVAGVEAELVMWHGRIGFSAEASRQWSPNEGGPQVGTLGASLRLLAFDRIVPSLLDTREVVELGIELQGVVERAWWDRDGVRDVVSYGYGLAVRLRGANHDDRSNLLSESRFFVRVLHARDAQMDVIARDTSPAERAGVVGVIFGLGALWGGGRPAYVEGLRPANALDSEWLVGR
jgi:hypothetical protein